MTATQALTVVILKILSWAYLVDRLSVCCSYQRQIVLTWSGSGGHGTLITVSGKLSRWVTELRKLASGFLKNLPRKTVAPMDHS